MQGSPDFFILLLSSFCLFLAVTSTQNDLETAATLKEQADSYVDDIYLPEFSSISRSIIGRADGSVSEDLRNNVPASSNTILPGNARFYRFPSKSLHGPISTQSPNPLDISRRQQEPEHQELRKRADDVTYYLSLNTCRQPTSSSRSDPPPQLLLLVSYVNPNPDGTQRNAHVPPVTDGFASFSDPTSSDVFVKVEAPSAPGYTGSYTFELAISIDGYYSNFVSDSTLYFVDSDKQAAMFVSTDLTQLNAGGSVNTDAVAAWSKNGPRYTLQIANQNDNRFNGLMKSSCALRNTTRLGSSAKDQTDLRVETGLTTTAGPALQQQFYLSGLKAGTSYFASMGLPSSDKAIGSGKPGGGGTTYNKIAFTTKIGTIICSP